MSKAAQLVSNKIKLGLAALSYSGTLCRRSWGNAGKHMGRVQGGKLCFWLVGGKAYPTSSWMLTPSRPQHTQEEFIKAATPRGEPQSELRNWPCCLCHPSPTFRMQIEDPAEKIDITSAHEDRGDFFPLFLFFLILSTCKSREVFAEGTHVSRWSSRGT